MDFILIPFSVGQKSKTAIKRESERSELNEDIMANVGNLIQMWDCDNEEGPFIGATQFDKGAI